MRKYNSKDKTYKGYKLNQIIRSKSKWNMQGFWHRRFEFDELMKEIYKITGKRKKICCMGIRSGNEYNAFRQENGYDGLPEFQGAKIYGVDICENVKDVGENCYCYDFSKLPKKWENKFDMIYSNSIDHSFDIEKTMDEWHRVSENGGYIVLSLSIAKNNRCDLYQFETGDEQMFDKNKFKFIKLWREESNINVLLKVIK